MAATKLVRCCCAVSFAAIAIAAARAEETKKPDNPRAMFQMLGVDDSYFERLTDGTPIDAAQRESLLRILFGLRRFPLVDLERWALPYERMNSVIEHPDHRGMIFRLRGRVLAIEPLKPTADQSERYEIDVYYRCRLQLEPSGPAVDVYTDKVPNQWKKGAKPNAPAGALGILLKRTETSGDQSYLVFASPRLAWYPDNPLGRLGMDVGLLGAVEDKTASGLDTPADREAFYQMLAAVGRAAPGELRSEAERNMQRTPAKWLWKNQQGEEQYSVAPLFNEPASQRGRLVELLGTARRVEEIRVTDADIVARFGIDHYYQVSLFTDDSQGNPVTFCLRELPIGMPYGNLPRYGEAVRIAGFFFTTWSYPVARAEAEKGDSPHLCEAPFGPFRQMGAVPFFWLAEATGDAKMRRQLSPLLIGRSLAWYPTAKPASSNLPSIIIGILLLAATVVIWLMAWRSRLRQRKRLARTDAPQKLDWPQEREST